MTQDWLFDFGNTRLKCAPREGTAGVGAVRVLAPEALAELPAGGVAYVASVAPEAAHVRLLDALAARFVRIAVARTLPRFGRLRIAYPHPHKLGVDRFLAMAGAEDAWPALVVGVGTALTIDLVDDAGLHRGGRIAPSPTLMREALHARARHLAPSGGAYVEFADDTEDALASGCEGAARALVDRSVERATALLGTPPRVLLHGGGVEALGIDGTSRPALVLEGLARWAGLELPQGGHAA